MDKQGHAGDPRRRGLWASARLDLAFSMTWEILWTLVLGFTLSAAVQAAVAKSEMTRLLPDDSPRTLAIACGPVPRPGHPCSDTRSPLRDLPRRASRAERHSASDADRRRARC